MNGPQVGEQAPDLLVKNAIGRVVPLANYWRDQPIVLVFLRHFG
ncbi:MAG: hypothetical protein U0768_20470 [Anaerolineae bacterium]